MTDKSEEEPDGYIDIPHLNAKIPFWNVPPVSLMDANPIYISKEDREKLLKTRADMCKNYAHAKTKTEYFHDEKSKHFWIIQSLQILIERLKNQAYICFME